MMKLRYGLVVILAQFATAAHAADPSSTFDLVCEGTVSTDSLLLKKTDAYHYVYRIDLEAKKYCDGECGGLHDIADIQPTAITFDSKSVDSFSEKSFSNNTVNRLTGAHTILYTTENPRDRGSIMIMKWEGQCAKAPFSGFPTFETKF